MSESKRRARYTLEAVRLREIQGFLAEQYATQVSPEFISSVTDAVMSEVAA